MNPYLKGRSFVKKNRKPGAEVSAIAKKPGSNERYVGANDEFNASSAKELAQVISQLQKDVSSGRVITPQAHYRKERISKIMADKKDMVTAAVHGHDVNAWQALGAVMGDEITTSGEREGFADNLLVNQTLGAGDIARFRVKEKQVSGWQAVSPARIAPSVIRQGYCYPEEFLNVA